VEDNIALLLVECVMCAGRIGVNPCKF